MESDSHMVDQDHQVERTDRLRIGIDSLCDKFIAKPPKRAQMYNQIQPVQIFNQ